MSPDLHVLGRQFIWHADVSRPTADGASLDQWNRTLQSFESQNGPGQGGPGFGTAGGGGNPYTANGIRHGTDAAQPGGSPAFTIAVTEDMCAQISACSGTQTKRGPVYIWHADVDEGAKIAADIATDFIPGVAQAKTAYDAYTRIQNGEDPVEVLAAAGADAALGLVPGLKAARKIDKALDKAEKVADVADAAGDVGHAARGTAANRASEIHGRLDPRAARARTTAVTETAEGTRVVSSSSRRLTPAQRAALRPGEVEGVGIGHAEMTGVEAARRMGLTPTGTAASRPICSTCATFLDQQGVAPLSPLKN